MAKPFSAIGKFFSNLGANTKSFTVANLGSPFMRWVQGVDDIRKSGTEQLQEYRGWTFAAVNAIAKPVGNIELVLKKVNRKGEVEDVPTHPILDTLYRANPMMSKTMLFFNLAAYLNLAGDGFWWLVRNRQGEVVEIWPLRPDLIEIKTEKDGSEILRYEMQVNGKTLRFEPEDILHFKTFNPLNPWRGMSVIQASALAIESDKEAAKWNYEFFKNSALPEGVLELEKESRLSDDEQKRLRAEWQRIHGDSGNAHKIAILTGGMKYHELTFNQRDMEFLSQREFSRDEVLSMFGVPKIMIGITEDVNYASADKGKEIFMQNTVKPWMDLIVDHLNEFFVPLYEKDDSGLFLDFTDPVPEDLAAKVETYTKATGLPVMTPNEARYELNLEDIGDAGDALYAPFSLMPLDSPRTVDTGDGQDDGSNQDAQDDKNDTKKAVMKGYQPIGKAKRPTLKPKYRYEFMMKSLTRLNRRLKTKELRETVVKGVAKEVMKKIGPNIYTAVNEAWKQSRKTKEWSDEQKDAFAKAFVRGVENYEARYYTDLRKHFRQEKDEVLKNLTRSRKSNESYRMKAVKDQVDAILFERAAQVAVLIEAGVPLTEAILIQFGIDAAKLLGTTFDDTNTRIARQVAKQVKLMARSVEDTTLEALRETLTEGIKAEESVVELTKRVESVYEDAGTTRARMIARTETVKAANRGNLEAYVQSGVVVKKMWLTSSLSNVCEFCLPMHGKIVDVEKDFFSKGDVVTGAEGGTHTVDYDDVDVPDFHPNCACTIVPIVSED